jgi:hypothetical protein
LSILLHVKKSLPWEVLSFKKSQRLKTNAAKINSLRFTPVFTFKKPIIHLLFPAYFLGHLHWQKLKDYIGDFPCFPVGLFLLPANYFEHELLRLHLRQDLEYRESTRPESVTSFPFTSTSISEASKSESSLNLSETSSLILSCERV